MSIVSGCGDVLFFHWRQYLLMDKIFATYIYIYNYIITILIDKFNRKSHSRPTITTTCDSSSFSGSPVRKLRRERGWGRGRHAGTSRGGCLRRGGSGREQHGGVAAAALHERQRILQVSTKRNIIYLSHRIIGCFLAFDFDLILITSINVYL